MADFSRPATTKLWRCRLTAGNKETEVLEGTSRTQGSGTVSSARHLSVGPWVIEVMPPLHTCITPGVIQVLWRHLQEPDHFLRKQTQDKISEPSVHSATMLPDLV